MVIPWPDPAPRRIRPAKDPAREGSGLRGIRPARDPARENVHTLLVEALGNLG
jgi:hypothetical protein